MEVMIMATTIYEYCNNNRIKVKIPEGFYFKEGEIDEGLVIENEHGDSFVRIPPGYTSDGVYVRGFWISAYYISKGEDGQAHSISGDYPWTEISFYEAKEVAEKFGGELLTSEEYNRICMWLVQTHACSLMDLVWEAIAIHSNLKRMELIQTGQLIILTASGEMFILGQHNVQNCMSIIGKSEAELVLFMGLKFANPHLQVHGLYLKKEAQPFHSE